MAAVTWGCPTCPQDVPAVAAAGTCRIHRVRLVPRAPEPAESAGPTGPAEPGSSAVTWRCPVTGCEETSDKRGRCSRHVVSLVAETASQPGEQGGEAPGAAPGTGEAAEPAAAGPARRFAFLLAGSRFEIPGDGMVIGRAIAPLRDVPAIRALEQISRRTQARLFWQNGTIYVEDAGSTNGTFVDGLRISEAVPIRPGTALRFGLDVNVQLVELDQLGMIMSQDRG